jgi:hypothetical protein
MSLAAFALTCWLQEAAPAASVAPPPRAPQAVPTPRPRAPEVPSYRVALRMKSGRRFSGVVGRDREFHALVHQGAHHSPAIYASESGFTLRYVDGLDGEIGLRWNQVEKLEVREILDSSGLRAMEQRFASARIVRRREAETESAKPAADPSAASSPSGADPASGAAPPVSPDPQVAPPKLSLLTEFPPDQGWSPDRKRQIEWRRTVVGSFPDERESRFLAVYDQWEPQFATWSKERELQREAEAEKVERSKADGRGGQRPVEPAPTPPANRKSIEAPPEPPAPAPATKPGDAKGG